MSDIIKRLITQVTRENAERLERCAEQALQSGRYGMASLGPGVCRVDEHVPYGHHFSFPSEDAYDRWVENGCPTS